jgi:hypothetical protein
MSTDEATIDAALQGLRDTLAADGYELAWSLEGENRVGIRVVAGSEACADCLVPAELMRSIVDDQLDRISYRVGTISLPSTS